MYKIAIPKQCHPPKMDKSHCEHMGEDICSMCRCTSTPVTLGMPFPSLWVGREAVDLPFPKA